jgi:hypothetical protein
LAVEVAGEVKGVAYASLLRRLLPRNCAGCGRRSQTTMRA